MSEKDRGGSADLTALLIRGLDRTDPTPLYHQAAELIRHAIGDGVLVPGARLENEVALADQVGISRPTVRRALQELVDRGLLVRRRGVGTQVVHPHINRSVALTSLHDDLVRDGQASRTEVLEHTLAPASDDIAEALGLDPGSRVLTLVRVRFADDEPLAVMTNYLPEALAPSRERLVTDGLYQCLREQGVHLRVARQRVGARLATAREARLLDERPRSPLVTMERTAYDNSGAVAEMGRHVYRASRYHVEMTLVDR